ncbi:MAG: hypothetical protein RLZ98_2961 [Pseudomonadota bacterium]
MSTATELDPLILDMLEWIAKAPRTYNDVMEGWRTSCPRLTVWEDAIERGFIARRRHHDNSVEVHVTPAGLAFLSANGRATVPHDAPPKDSSPKIAGWHAHVYFDADSRDKARRLCEKASRTLGILMGRMHERPVGPHPDWSCQLTVPADRFDEVIPWLALNRDGLNILVHPETGNSLHDHRDHAIWMGAVRPLDFTQFLARAAE